MFPRWYARAVAFVAVAGFYTHAWHYLTLSEPADVVGKGYLLWLAFAAPGLARPRVWRGLLRTPLSYWVAGYILLVVLSALYHGIGPEEMEGVKREVLLMWGVLACLVAFRRPEGYSMAFWSIVSFTVLGAVVNVVEALVPGLLELSQGTGRSAGLYVNPNISAMVLTLGTVATVRGLPSWLQPWYVTLVALAVLLTWSRAGVIGLALVLLGLLWVEIRWSVSVGGLWTARRVGAVGFAAVLLIGVTPVLVADLLSSPHVEVRAVQLRSGQVEYADRLEFAKETWESFLERPFTGHGFMASVPVGTKRGPHNMYLSLAMDYGVVGLGVLPALLLAMAGWKLRNLVSLPVVYVAYSALFTHNLLEFAVMIVVSFVASGVRPDAGNQLTKSAPRGA